MSRLDAERAELTRLAREIEVGCDQAEPERIRLAVAARELLLLRWRDDPRLGKEPQLRALVAAQGAELIQRLGDFQHRNRQDLTTIVRAGEIRRGYGQRSGAASNSALDRSG